MNVLIIEDTTAKANAVEAEITKNLNEKVKYIARADSLSEAISAFERRQFDLIILDLMVPFIPKGVADRGAGLELLKHIRSVSCKSRNSLVIGLSAFPDEVENARPEFDRLAVVIVHFASDNQWKTPLAMACADASRIATKSHHVDFVILVALEEEKEGFVDTALTLGSKAIVGGLNVQFARLTGTTESEGVIILHRRMGLVAATLDATAAISIFRPKIVAMSGICAGFADRAKLGQLVIASPSWEYQAGKWSNNKFLVEPLQVSIPPRTKIVIDQLISDISYVQQLEKNVAWVGDRPSSLTKAEVLPGVTGSAVIADRDRLKHIPDQHRKVSVLDMETYGVYAACFEAERSIDHFFSVKAVVDLADSEKADDLHSYGSAMAAAATIDIIREILIADTSLD